MPYPPLRKKVDVLRKNQRARQGEVAREVGAISQNLDLEGFLSPTSEKKSFHLLLSILLGISFLLIYSAAQMENIALYWISFSSFILLSFPAFLLWQGYGIQALSNEGIPFAVFSVLLETIWLYLLACAFALMLKKGAR